MLEKLKSPSLQALLIMTGIYLVQFARNVGSIYSYASIAVVIAVWLATAVVVLCRGPAVLTRAPPTMPSRHIVGYFVVAGICVVAAVLSGFWFGYAVRTHIVPDTARAVLCGGIGMLLLVFIAGWSYSMSLFGVLLNARRRGT